VFWSPYKSHFSSRLDLVADVVRAVEKEHEPCCKVGQGLSHGEAKDETGHSDVENTPPQQETCTYRARNPAFSHAAIASSAAQ